MTTSTAPLSLPSLTSAQAHALRLLAQRAQAASFAWGGQTWQVSLRPHPTQTPVDAGPDAWWIRLSWSGWPFDLRVSETALQDWLRARFPDLDLPLLPDPLCASVLEAACDSLVALLQEGTPDPVVLERWLPGGEPGRGLPHVVDIELRTGRVVLRAQLSTSTPGLLFLAEQVAAREPACNDTEFDALPVTLVAAIGMTWLGIDEVARLKPRDTILFDVRLLDEDGQLWIVQGNAGFRVQRQGPDLTVTEQFMTRGWTVPPEEEDGAPRSELSSLEDLPLRVVFDLGELTLSLGELRALQVGQPLSLARPLSSAVAVRVNGALIGTGELVDIEGELGVTLTSLFQRPATKPARATRSAPRTRTRSAPEVPDAPEAPEEVAS